MGKSLYHERRFIIFGIQMGIESIVFLEFLLCGVEFVSERHIFRTRRFPLDTFCFQINSESVSMMPIRFYVPYMFRKVLGNKPRVFWQLHFASFALLIQILFCLREDTQILFAIVEAVSIDVVDRLGRALPCMVETIHDYVVEIERLAFSIIHS